METKTFTFTFYVEGLNVERRVVAATEKAARIALWAGLNDCQRNCVVSIDCVEQVAA